MIWKLVHLRSRLIVLSSLDPTSKFRLKKSFLSIYRLAIFQKLNTNFSLRLVTVLPPPLQLLRLKNLRLDNLRSSQKFRPHRNLPPPKRPHVERNGSLNLSPRPNPTRNKSPKIFECTTPWRLSTLHRSRIRRFLESRRRRN